MKYLVVLALVAGALAGCGARTLDDLSSSYERLASQANAPQQAEPRSPSAAGTRLVAPPSGNLGSSFLVVGRDALDAADSRGADGPTRIALYRIAASSAHFVLLEEVATGRNIGIVSPSKGQDAGMSADPGVSGAAVMRRAVSEGTALCNTVQPRPPRDCAYLVMAEPLAELAIVSEPWLHLPSITRPGQTDAVALLVDGLGRAPDRVFNPAVAGYKAASDRALAQLGGSADAPGGVVRPNSPRDYVRTNDILAYCIVAARALKTRSLPTDVTVTGIDRNALAAGQNDMERWVTQRHGIPAPKCQS